MKKLLVVLLSLGLIAAFSATASAADVKFGGMYYLYGAYDNNPTLANSDSYSRAYIYQRLRLLPVFSIAEGLSLTVQFDALEKQWGNTDWRRGSTAVGDDATSSRPSSAGTANTVTGVYTANANAQENVEFERVYMTFNTAIGQFQIGYQAVGGWGTSFGDSVGSGPRLLYTTMFGPVTLLAIYEKPYEADTTAVVANQLKVDADNDTYALGAIYKQKGIEAGALLKYYNYRGGAAAVAGANLAAAPGRNGAPNAGQTQWWLFAPYAKATFGPVFVEAEVNYNTGKWIKSEVAGQPDIKIDGWNGYIHGKMNFGPAYAGAMFAYNSGDDASDATKTKASLLGGGTSWSPALLLGNFDTGFMSTNGAANPTAGGQSITSQKFNTIWYSIYGGYNPTAKLNVEANLIYATVDKTLATNPNQKKDLGAEIDLKATYKIYDNLSYMVGAAYLWTGDWFKGNTPATTQVGNEYYLLNKLTLSF